MALLSIGIDDTDSPSGMCTTYVGYRLASRLRALGDSFDDYPRLVRLNPNVPWRTRGNGAVALRVLTADPGRARAEAEEALRSMAEVRRGANPAAVFCEGPPPPELAELAGEALRRVVRPADAGRLARRLGLGVFSMGGGRGVVGAAAAVGCDLSRDSTLELIAYRRRGAWGTPRGVGDAEALRAEASPGTFSSYCPAARRGLVAPRGPDPVLYGVRGDGAARLLAAQAAMRCPEEPAGHAIYRTNQGTGAHLARPVDAARPEPHSCGTVSGEVAGRPRVLRGGHAVFAVRAPGGGVWCAAYRRSGMAAAAAGLAPGDAVEVGGGVRPAAPGRPPVLNAEFVRVVRLAPVLRRAGPPCRPCGRRMKSKGRGQGFACPRCGARAASAALERAPRSVREGLHLPVPSAQRHLARPASRQGASWAPAFEPGLWLR